MKILLHILYSVASLSFVALVGLTLTGHIILTAQQRMINVVDDKDPTNVLFQMPTNITDYRVVFVK